MKTRYAVAFVLVALVATVALAGDVYDTYQQAQSAVTQQITGATVADSLALDTAIPGRRQACGMNTTVVVEADLSGSAGDTVVIYFVPYFADGGNVFTRMPGLQSATATAGATTDAAADSVCDAIFFEIPAGATHYEIRHAAPSAGNVDISWSAYSAEPQ